MTKYYQMHVTCFNECAFLKMCILTNPYLNKSILKQIHFKTNPCLVNPFLTKRIKSAYTFGKRDARHKHKRGSWMHVWWVFIQKQDVGSQTD